MNTKIIVITNDIILKHFLTNELSQRKYTLLPQISNVSEIPSKIDKNDPHILLLDIEGLVPLPNPIFLKNLIDNFGLNIILIGIKNASAYLMQGIRNTISRPQTNSQFSKKIFLKIIVEKIELINHSFNKAFNLGNQENIRDAADINNKVIAIASSTGGTEALATIFKALPQITPPILVVQHMPSLFTNQFANRLDVISKISVKEALINDCVKPNSALIAPGDYHMKIFSRSSKLLIECFKGEKVHALRPAADVLFDSMAGFMGKNVIGVVLTGIGSDGAQGLYKLKKRGAAVIAQNQETCVVYGMPKTTIELGVADYILPLDKIADKIMQLSR